MVAVFFLLGSVFKQASDDSAANGAEEPVVVLLPKQSAGSPAGQSPHHAAIASLAWGLTRRTALVVLALCRRLVALVGMALGRLTLVASSGGITVSLGGRLAVLRLAVLRLAVLRLTVLLAGWLTILTGWLPVRRSLRWLLLIIVGLNLLLPARGGLAVALGVVVAVTRHVVRVGWILGCKYRYQGLVGLYASGSKDGNGRRLLEEVLVDSAVLAR